MANKSVFQRFEEAGPPPYERTWTFEFQGETHTLYYCDYLKMVKNKLDMRFIYSRLKNGWDLFDALDAPREISKYDYKEWAYKREFEARERRLKKKKEEEMKIKKPWLNTVPQSVKPSLWFKYLSENDIFPKRRSGSL